MSGHSKWATIKRAKGAKDAKKGAIFTKLGNLITIAAREKGGDLEANFALRMAVDKARSANMPKETIERAIKRGTGELQGEDIQELYYEGVGPAGSQVIVKSLTDSKNRSASNIRHIFSKAGGSLGSVMWNFEQKGVIRIASDDFGIANEEEELGLIEMGAQDIQKDRDGLTIIAKVEDLQALKKYFDGKEIKTESADIEYVAKEEIELAAGDQEKYEKFTEELDDNEDVADYYSNVK